MLFVEHMLYVFDSEHCWDERDAWANVTNSLFKLAVEALVLGAVMRRPTERSHWRTPMDALRSAYLP